MSNSRFRTHLVVRQRHSDEPQNKAAPAKKNNTSRDVMLESTVDRSSRQGQLGGLLLSQFGRFRLADIRTQVRAH